MIRTLLSTFLLSIALVSFSQNKTTISAGAWTNPAIWFPTGVPNGSEVNVLINHQVTFTGMLPLGSDSFLITTNGCLTGSSGNDTLVTGATVFGNYGGIDVKEFITSDDFLNYGRVKVSQNFNQSGNFWIYTGGKVDVGMMFNSSDNVMNDGELKCAQWTNGALVSGIGNFCISACFINTSSIAGTLDICDATPSTICDVNGGSIAPSVTYCVASPCTGVSVACVPSGVNDFEHEKVNVSVFPNPSGGNFSISVDDSELKMIRVIVYDVTGKNVLEQQFNSNKGHIKLSRELKGMFFVEVSDTENRIIITKKIVVH